MMLLYHQMANFSILDIRRHSTISILGISEILDSFKNSGEKIDYEINEDRLDTYVSPIEWSSDSTRILISYQAKDAGYKTQSGDLLF